MEAFRKTVTSPVSLPALPVEAPTSSGLSTQYQSPPDPSSSSTNSSAVFIVLGSLITIISVILLILLIILIKRKKNELKLTPSAGFITSLLPLFLRLRQRKQQPWKSGPSNSFQRYKFTDIRKATDDFSTIIGRGGYGTVFKARFEDGLIAAVKRMNVISKQSQQEFLKEMEFLGRLHHRHLVSLKGFCVRKQERFLVYEYMENGCLKEHLLGGGTKCSLSWQRRLQIAMDVASALEYLHCYCNPPLCHRDIKSSNILLDEKFTAKIADFGLAHVAPENPSIGILTSTTDMVRGTPGYMDPEYVITRRLTDKSDIYSYGVLLLELISGRGAVQDNINIVEWAQKYFGTEPDMLLLVDSDIRHTCNLDELKKIISLIKMCTRKEGKARPNIQQVVRWLLEKLDINNAEALQYSSLFMLSRDYLLSKESPNYLNMSDDFGSLSSSLSPYTDCCVSFRFETTPSVSPSPEHVHEEQHYISP